MFTSYISKALKGKLMYTNIIYVTAKVDKLKLLRRYLLKLESTIRAETGCVTWDVNQSIENPLVWVIYEVWENEDAIYLHYNQPHIIKLNEELPLLIDNTLDSTNFKMITMHHNLGTSLFNTGQEFNVKKLIKISKRLAFINENRR